MKQKDEADIQRQRQYYLEKHIDKMNKKRRENNIRQVNRLDNYYYPMDNPCGMSCLECTHKDCIL
jgi:hypothetical protein